MKGEITCSDPNRHAATASASLLPGNVAVVKGYQCFVALPTAIGVSTKDTKAQLVAPWLTPRHLKDRSVLDLGANAGLYSLLSAQNGARIVTAVEIDEDYLDLMRRVSRHVGVGNLQVARGNVADWGEPADVVLALALVHWIYSCSAVIGSLHKVVELLSGLARYLLLVEWVSADDPAIEFFGHLGWNRDRVEGPYDREAFEEALAGSFARIEFVGEPSGTRRIYAAFKAAMEIDLSCPLPLVQPREALLSSRRLVRLGGLDYWSRVYVGPAPGDVLKQTNLGLATREHAFLGRLHGPHFPRAKGLDVAGDSSSARIEFVEGSSLEQAYDRLRSDREAFATFFRQCLAILEQLYQKGIVHRDIREANIVLRASGPVLLDFGWAVAPDLPVSAPPPLGAGGRPPDGTFCDVYSMGLVLKAAKGAAHPEFDGLIGLMTHPEAHLRLTDLAMLVELSDIIRAHRGARVEAGGPVSEQAQDEGAPSAATMRRVLDQVVLLERREDSFRSQIASLEAELAAKTSAVSTLSDRILEYEGAALAGLDARARDLGVRLEAEQAARSDERASWTAQLASKDAEISSMNARLTQVMSELAHIHVALAESKGFIAAQTAQLDDLKRSFGVRLWKKLATYLGRRPAPPRSGPA